MTDRPRMFDHLEGQRMGDRLIYLGNYLLEMNSESNVDLWMYRYHMVHQYLSWLMEKDAEQKAHHAHD